VPDRRAYRAGRARSDNAAATARARPSLLRCRHGNGIQLQDTSGGAARSRSSAPISPGIDDLGFSDATVVSGTTLVSADVERASRQHVSALLNLHAALVKGDTSAITRGRRSHRFVHTSSSRLHGRGRGRSQAMSTRLQYTEAAVDSSTALLSEVKDLDYTEAITALPAGQTTLQAT